MLTEKENYLRVVNGEMPEWIPRIGFPSPGHMPATGGGGISVFRGEPVLDADGNVTGRTDIWGVEYVAVKEISNAALPVPDKFILEDITKWRDIVKTPAWPDSIDWEAQAATDTERVDRTQTAMTAGAGGFFLPLMNMMGFSEGLCAMHEEPDEVRALFDYMLEFYMKQVDVLLQYYKPDLFSLSDDIAAAGNLFVSPQMYRDLVKPYHNALAEKFVAAGIPIGMHCCGLSDDIVDDWVEIGVRVWNPAQVMNNLLHWKEKYKGVLALEGCFDSHGPGNWPHAPEELVKQAVRDCIDTYAPGGGFIFWGSSYGDPDDPDTENKARWITEEYDRYGRTFYQNS